MGRTITIAVTNSYNDTVTMLPPSAYIDEIGNAAFHNNPRLEFDGKNISSNFDHHIDFRISKNKLHQELITNNYHHYPRLKRMTQYLNVFKFNQSRTPSNLLEITIPKYYLATLRDGEHVAVTNFGIPNCDKVVIKEQLGARGSNQVVVPTNMLTTLLKHSKDKTLGEVKDMFPDLIYTDNSDWDLEFFADLNDLFISELITNVKSEFRLLVGGKKIYGRARSINAGPYPQANLEVDKFHTVQEVKYDPIEDMFDSDLVETLYAFVEYIDLPIGSVDLYSTSDGDWGIFEYSTQFAFHGADPVFIRQLLLDGIKKVILDSRPQLTTKTVKRVNIELDPEDSSPNNTVMNEISTDDVIYKNKLTKTYLGDMKVLYVDMLSEFGDNIDMPLEFIYDIDKTSTILKDGSLYLYLKHRYLELIITFSPYILPQFYIIQLDSTLEDYLATMTYRVPAEINVKLNVLFDKMFNLTKEFRRLYFLTEPKS